MVARRSEAQSETLVGWAKLRERSAAKRAHHHVWRGTRCASLPTLRLLPGTPPNDPADRILIATARELAATLVTRDRAIIAYGETGNVSVVEC